MQQVWNYICRTVKVLCRKLKWNWISLKKGLIKNRFECLFHISTKSGLTQTKYGDNEVIVSMTTYGIRAHHAYLTIESLMHQTVKPNHIILWLDESEFSRSNLPLSLKKLQKRGLEIMFTENIKSYKKLIPALKAFPSEVIITVDDDVIYPSNLIKILLLEHKNNPHDIICTHGHIIKFDVYGDLLPYIQWPDCPTYKSIASNSFLQIGIGGVLYPPHSLHPDVTNSEYFMRLSPTADDLWFKVMALKQGTIVRVSPIYHDFNNWITETNIEGDVSLFDINLTANDIQLRNLFSFYHLSFHDFGNLEHEN